MKNANCFAAAFAALMVCACGRFSAAVQHPITMPICGDAEAVVGETNSAVMDAFDCEQKMEFVRRGIGSTVVVRARKRVLADAVDAETFFAGRHRAATPGSTVAGSRTDVGTGVIVGKNLVLATAHTVKDAAFVYVSRRGLSADGKTIRESEEIEAEVLRVAVLGGEEGREIGVALLKADISDGSSGKPLPVRRGRIAAEGEQLWLFGPSMVYSTATFRAVIADDGISYRIGEMIGGRIRLSSSGAPVVALTGELVGIVQRRRYENVNWLIYFLPIEDALAAVGLR